MLYLYAPGTAHASPKKRQGDERHAREQASDRR